MTKKMDYRIEIGNSGRPIITDAKTGFPATKYPDHIEERRQNIADLLRLGRESRADNRFTISKDRASEIIGEMEEDDIDATMDVWVDENDDRIVTIKNSGGESVTVWPDKFSGEGPLFDRVCKIGEFL